MLRPATPLTVLLLIAFLLLLVSVVSTPIIKQIPLAAFKGVDFGVFGFCKGSTCSPIEIGYSTDGLFTAAETSTFDLPSATRTTLSAILIVHPIAALFTLVLLILAASAHFHAPSHSPRYLLAIFILSILTLILSLLSFLIDVLLFVPHMAWGSYIVLAATILVAASGIVSCAMRRTLVSRKARKRRIAENAEMNGENFYNRQGGTGTAHAPTMESNTLVNGGPGVDKLPAFATFETAKAGAERTSDERVPLTNRSPTDPSSNNMAPMVENRYGAPPSRGNGSPPRAPRQFDQYGNPMPPLPGTYNQGPPGPPSRDPSLNRQYSDQSMRGRGGGMPPPGFRGGRGGGYPNNRGGYAGPRGGYMGPPRGRGGFAPRGRGGPPPPGYGQNAPGYNRGQSPAGGYRGPPSAEPPVPKYGDNTYAAAAIPATALAGGYQAFRPEEDRSSLARAESPPPLPGFDDQGPVGQAVELDATTGSPSHAPRDFQNFGPIRESDGDVAGMVGLQQQLQNQRDGRQTVVSESSRYSIEDCVPPRQAWGQNTTGRSSPLNPNPQAADLSRQVTGPGAGAAIPGSRSNRRQSSDNYYEDVDPRFADDQEPQAQPPPGMVPTNLGTNYADNRSERETSQVQMPPSQGMVIDGNYSYEDIASGQRSPAESERSNFTSVSQRGINPRWQGPNYGAGGPMPNRRPPQQAREDLLLNSNPDFMLPGASRGGRGGSRGGRGGPPGMGRIPGQIPGMVPNSAYPHPGSNL